MVARIASGRLLTPVTDCGTVTSHGDDTHCEWTYLQLLRVAGIWNLGDIFVCMVGSGEGGELGRGGGL